MSSAAGPTVQQLRQDIQHELTTANQLARLISNELQIIKNFTNPGGEFDSNIKQNANLIAALASTCHINMENIAPMVRRPANLTQENQNNSLNEHNTHRNESHMDDTQ